jgi:hypothetical protein
MRRAVADPRVPVKYTPRIRHYKIVDFDGGPAGVEITHCPWCGAKLPESLGERRIDDLAEMGLEPEDPAVPEEYRTDEWWKRRGL